eukprot:13366-Heterococcus_DN1.PRE.1
MHAAHIVTVPRGTVALHQSCTTTDSSSNNGVIRWLSGCPSGCPLVERHREVKAKSTHIHAMHWNQLAQLDQLSSSCACRACLAATACCAVSARGKLLSIAQCILHVAACRLMQSIQSAHRCYECAAYVHQLLQISAPVLCSSSSSSASSGSCGRDTTVIGGGSSHLHQRNSACCSSSGSIAVACCAPSVVLIECVLDINFIALTTALTSEPACNSSSAQQFQHRP